MRSVKRHRSATRRMESASDIRLSSRMDLANDAHRSPISTQPSRYEIEQSKCTKSRSAGIGVLGFGQSRTERTTLAGLGLHARRER